MERRYNLHGEIDLAAETQLRAEFAAIVATPGVHLLIDAAHVTFMDSTGIRVILDTHLALESRGRHLIIVNLPAEVRRSFEILGLDHLCRYHRDAIHRELEHA